MRQFVVLFILVCTLYARPAFAWGIKGHRLIALIAKSQLSDTVIENVDYYLKGMSWEDAACWMEKAEANPAYDYMKPWHFFILKADNTLVQPKDQNLIFKLEFCIRMLQFRQIQTLATMHEILKTVFNLIGDLHQPLHCGSADDNAGQYVKLTYMGKETTLHQLWDEAIIEEKKMDIWHCSKVLVGMNLSSRKRLDLEKFEIVNWMNDTKTVLPEVYKLNAGKADQAYIDHSAAVIETQLVKAGLRLAAILNKYFR